MQTTLMKAGALEKFSCSMNISIPSGPGVYERVHVIAIFRFIPHEDIDAWLMPMGKPRSDQSLAQEVLLEVSTIARGKPGALWEPIEVSDILATDSGAAMVVSTYLAALPQVRVREHAPSPAAFVRRSTPSLRVI